MSEDIIFGLRYWDTGVPEIEGFHIAEELDSKNTVTIKPNDYEKLNGIQFERQEVYVRK
tara:strand:+ start:6023 stop:6199 length:177 start_codon:yes stop_codon:yes gene_type:complete